MQAGWLDAYAARIVQHRGILRGGAHQVEIVVRDPREPTGDHRDFEVEQCRDVCDGLPTAAAERRTAAIATGSPSAYALAISSPVLPDHP